MKALFAGSFDPFTKGHLDIVERALNVFDKVFVGIGTNGGKTPMWTIEDRVCAVKGLFKGNPRVEVSAYQCLTAEHAREIGADVLIRGVRDTVDFEYEKNLADANRQILGIDTVFMVSKPELGFVSSSMVRELIRFGRNANEYIAGDFQIPTKKR